MIRQQKMELSPRTSWFGRLLTTMVGGWINNCWGCCTTTPQDIAALHEYLEGGARHD